MFRFFEKKEANRFWMNLLVVLGGISFYFLLDNLQSVTGFLGNLNNILKPFLYGFVIAFLMNTPVMFFDQMVGKVLKNRTAIRAIAVVITFILLITILLLLSLVLGPQLYDSGATMVSSIQRFVSGLDENSFEAIQQWFIDYNLPIDVYNQLADQWMGFMSQASYFLLAAMQYIISYTGTITNGLTNLLIALVVSVYLLLGKEYFFAQSRKLCHALFPRKTVEVLFRIGNLISDTFNGFINGKIIDSIIMGLLIFICMTILRIPYVALVSLICGFTNIIPFFGPFIGAIPSIFIIFIVSPIKALEFLVLILVLQQLDGNVIGPKILGDSTGLSAFWVMFAILVGGGLAGFVGMVLGVPTFAVLFTLAKEYINKRLAAKNLPTSTAVYDGTGMQNEMLSSGTEIVTGDTVEENRAVQYDVAEGAKEE